MTPEMGHFALILALFVSVIQGCVPMVGAVRRNALWMGVARPAAIAQSLLIAIAFGALMTCYVTSDFSVLNVAQNSHTDKPLLYKIAGVWGNHEGSMLLWVLILSLYGMAVAIFGGALPAELRTRALAVQGLLAFGFLLFILLTSNPFLRLDPAPLNGAGLNPILQDPGLAFHPPFLYMGYVGFSMAFSFAMAALLEGTIDGAWARYVRPWTLLAWSFLTFGIAMGSWWAYYTLGWGGWWYWDPVENASFMPWLTGTALVHSLVVVERRESLKAWTVLLAIITFSLSLLGTFLVRSGALTSVHSFAADPARGVFILVLLTVITGGALVLFAIRAPALQAGATFAPVSREGAIVLNNMLMSAAAGSVLLGTLYPLFLDVLELDKISVGPPFFNTVFLPLMVPMIMVMAIGPLLAWKRATLSKLAYTLQPAAALAVVVVMLVWVWGRHIPNAWWAGLALALAAWLFAGTMTGLIQRIYASPFSVSAMWRRAVALPKSFYGMTLAHAGLAVTIVGITCSSAWKTEKIQVMQIGESVTVAGYMMTLEGIEKNVKGPNYTALQATFTVRKNGDVVTILHPQKRVYTAPPRPTTNAAIYTTLAGDLYAVIGEEDKNAGYVTRLYFNPLVPCIFIGAGIMALGGIVALSDRRSRKKTGDV